MNTRSQRCTVSAVATITSPSDSSCYTVSYAGMTFQIGPHYHTHSIRAFCNMCDQCGKTCLEPRAVLEKVLRLRVGEHSDGPDGMVGDCLICMRLSCRHRIKLALRYMTHLVR